MGHYNETPTNECDFSGFNPQYNVDYANDELVDDNKDLVGHMFETYGYNLYHMFWQMTKDPNNNTLFHSRKIKIDNRTIRLSYDKEKHEFELYRENDVNNFMWLLSGENRETIARGNIHDIAKSLNESVKLWVNDDGSEEVHFSRFVPVK
jgi:uncharacterized protein YegP (UPF0339 family)